VTRARAADGDAAERDARMDLNASSSRSHADRNSGPAMRTVGFNVPQRMERANASSDVTGEVARELKRMDVARGTMDVAIARKASDASDVSASDQGGLARSREPVMIMPARARGKVAHGGDEPRKEGGERASATEGASATATAAVVVAPSERVVVTTVEHAQRSYAPKVKLTKSERRELQESQRAAKAAAKEEERGSGKAKEAQATGGKGERDSVGGKTTNGQEKKPTANVQENANGAAKKKVTTANAATRSVLRESASHLRAVNTCYVPQASSMHPAVERLAVDYARGTTSGARERVHSLLRVLRLVVESFEVPEGTTYAHALTSHLNQVVHALDKARPMGIAMGNAVRSLKTHLARLSHEEGQKMSDEVCRSKTLMHIDYFIKEKLDAALESIVKTGAALIKPGDVIITHGASQAVSAILIRAHEAGITFTVTIVDSRPSCEGTKILRHLSARGIDCAFTALNGLSYAMKYATKVLIGAAACMSNGVVLSRIGSSAVAHAAGARGIPVYVAAETCKFHERVQLDATVFNELGCDDDVVRIRPGVDGVLATRPENLTIFNLTYDAIPAQRVDAIICEAGSISPTAVLCYVLHS